MLSGKLDMPYNYYNLMPLDIVVKAANEALERITILREQREGWPEDSRRERYNQQAMFKTLIIIEHTCSGVSGKNFVKMAMEL